MKAELVPENGDPPIPIVRDISVVGRREFCDIRIDHPTISKRHCILVRTAGLLILRDLATTNGTKVKGQRVRWAALLPGDRISFGGYKARVYLGPDAAASPSEMHGVGRETIFEDSFASPSTPMPVGRADDPRPAPSPAAKAPTPAQAPPLVLDDGDLVPEEDDGWDKFKFISKPPEGQRFIIDLD